MSHDTRERRRLTDAFICYACLRPIPYGQRTYRADLGVLLHYPGPCSDLATRLSRDHDRSQRGHWVPAAEVCRRFREHWPSTPPPRGTL